MTAKADWERKTARSRAGGKITKGERPAYEQARRLFHAGLLHSWSIQSNGWVFVEPGCVATDPMDLADAVAFVTHLEQAPLPLEGS